MGAIVIYLIGLVQDRKINRSKGEELAKMYLLLDYFRFEMLGMALPFQRVPLLQHENYLYQDTLQYDLDLSA